MWWSCSSNSESYPISLTPCIAAPSASFTCTSPYSVAMAAACCSRCSCCITMTSFTPLCLTVADIHASWSNVIFMPTQRPVIMHLLIFHALTYASCTSRPYAYRCRLSLSPVMPQQRKQTSNIHTSFIHEHWHFSMPHVPESDQNNMQATPCPSRSHWHIDAHTLTHPRHQSMPVQCQLTLWISQKVIIEQNEY